MRPVYLDYAATTPMDPAVAQIMADYLTLDGVFANPASRSHIYGWQAEEAVETARQKVAALIGAEAREIVWTSGATESDNLAIKGVMESRLDAGQGSGKHIVTSAIEHKAVLDTCQYLESRYGFQVTYLRPDPKGLIYPDQVLEALRENTVLVSLMQVNNELGTITDINAIADITRQRGILLHVDAAQSAGKLAIDVRTTPVDLMSLSSHKIYGPKGMGALYVRRSPQVKLTAQIHGGGHERGMRSGTLASHQIVGMGEAFSIAGDRLEQDCQHVTALRKKLWQGLSHIEGARLNGDSEQRVSGILNVAFEGVEGETLMLALRDLAVASGSACNSASVAPSYVVKSLGLPDDLALAAVRFSLGRFTTEEEIDFTIQYVTQTLARLRV
ncbi:IscS subfamily cysteine desulfurase [Ketobacter sp. MCCC 1A13808]|uniref:IscS subfamily cysteine desulfurase n=1 Tax=Ketobacter sp. MCCC 1A13808 TaxID=2602738 RepID=UPI0012EB6B2D|nr:IscS subfamily cysteine desulfurase [Ketobacter sp. MCCC 1A13808]MVF14550.1 IscS subfamily cysteine desulfurase [Ketobacter sp. MCCC 1A13808]